MALPSFRALPPQPLRARMGSYAIGSGCMAEELRSAPKLLCGGGMQTTARAHMHAFRTSTSSSWQLGCHSMPPVTINSQMGFVTGGVDGRHQLCPIVCICRS
eukprot:2838861-Alexandrium_andersonii.AAC.1